MQIAMNERSLYGPKLGPRLLFESRHSGESIGWPSRGGPVASQGYTSLLDCNSFDSPRNGLFYGLPAAVFTEHVASWGGASSESQSRLRHTAQVKLTSAKRHAEMGQLFIGDYDLVQGAAGYVIALATVDPAVPELRELLEFLISIASADAADFRNCGWHVFHPQNPFDEAAWAYGGHTSLGMAHGVAGLIAAMSITLLAGVAIPRQRQVIDRLTTYLLEQRRSNQDGDWWPSALDARVLEAGNCSRDDAPLSWCVGVAGNCAAIDLAGHALGDREYSSSAIQIFNSSLRSTSLKQRVLSGGLCHGWAGIVSAAQAISSRNQYPRLGKAALISAGPRPSWRDVDEAELCSLDLALDLIGSRFDASGCVYSAGGAWTRAMAIG